MSGGPMTGDPMTRGSMTGGLVAGFDVGGTNIRAEVVGPGGLPAAAARRRIRPGSMGDIVEAICDMTDGIEEELAGGVTAVGVGCAGIVNRSGKVVTSPNIPEIRDFPLQSLLSERLERPVAVDNDATAALRGEMGCGAAAGVENVLLVTFGTGIGAALGPGRGDPARRARAGR